MRRTREMYLEARGELVIVVDCADLDRSATFWTSVLGYSRSAAGGNTYLGLVPSTGAGVEVLLQRVPDIKAAKNRVHLDLRTRDLESEVARILALGGRVLTDEPVIEGGWAWHVLADPDGNELCVLQPPTEYWEWPEGSFAS